MAAAGPHAAYSRACLPFIEELLLRRGSMRDLLAAVDTRLIFEPEVRGMDPRGLSCFNVNSAQDLGRARAIWGGERRSA